MEPEFDQYSDRYNELLRDPIRDAFANGNEFFHERKWRLIQRFFADRAADTRRLRWLDVGSGKGELLRLGRSEFACVAGCDPSPEMIRGCIDLPVRLQENPVALPFQNESFDFITAVCVFHHVQPEDRRALMKHIWRVLAPGGIFTVIEHNPLNPVTRLIVSRTPVDRTAKLLRAAETELLLKDCGFSPSDKMYFLYFPERLYRMIGAAEEWFKRIPLGGQYAIFGLK